MASGSKIQWLAAPGYTPGSWNPWMAWLISDPAKRGWFCEKVPGRKGCAHCYAASLNMFRGTGLDYARRNRELVGQKLYNLNLPRRKQKPHFWFVDSMTDLFGEWYPDEEIRAIVDEMIAVRRHIYVILTKRHERMQDFLTRYYPAIADQKHIWWGVSCEDQGSANASIPYLRATPAAVCVVSYEPAVGPVNWDEAFGEEWIGQLPGWWMLIGGESAQSRAHAAIFSLTWAHSTLAWCRSHGVVPNMKQLGSFCLDENGDEYKTQHPKGGEISEWPKDLQVREWPVMEKQRA